MSLSVVDIIMILSKIQLVEESCILLSICNTKMTFVEKLVIKFIYWRNWNGSLGENW